MNLIESKLQEKSVTTLELFFDLVFVFAITQVVGFIVHDPTLSGLLRAATLLGILWWGWTNWTWVTNIVSLEPRIRRIALGGGAEWVVDAKHFAERHGLILIGIQAVPGPPPR